MRVKRPAKPKTYGVFRPMNLQQPPMLTKAQRIVLLQQSAAPSPPKQAAPSIAIDGDGRLLLGAENSLLILR